MKNIKFYLFIGVLMVSALKAEAQVQTAKWDWVQYGWESNTSNGMDSGIDYQGAIIDEDGNTYVYGVYTDYYGWWGFFLEKYNSQGYQEWFNSNSDGQGADPVFSYCKVSMDKKGHLYVVGEPAASDTTNFNGVTVVASSPINMFIVCYDTLGNTIWANSIPFGEFPEVLNSDSLGNTVVSNGSNIIVFNSAGKIVFNDYYDAGIAYSTWDASHNFYVLGNYYKEINIDGENYYSNLDTNQFVAYIIKYSPNYEKKWVKFFKSSNGDAYLSGFCTDKYGNTIIAGNFTSNYYYYDNYANHYTYSDTSSLMIGDIKLINYDSANTNGFFAYSDSTGKVQWAHSMGSSVSISSAAIDLSDNIYFSGSFQDTALFGKIPLSASSTDNFLARYDINGNAIWAKDFGDTGVIIYHKKNGVNFFLFNQNFIVDYDMSLKPIWFMSGGGYNTLYSRYYSSFAANSKGDIALVNGNVAEISPCTAPYSKLTAPDTLYHCPGDSISLTIKSTPSSKGYVYFLMDLNNGNVIYSSDSIIKVGASGTYYAYVENSTGCQSSTDSVTVHFYPVPNTAFFHSHRKCNDSLTADITANKYQWYFNSAAIPLAISKYYIATMTGNYSLELRTQNGCTTLGAAQQVLIYASTPNTITPLGKTSYCYSDTINVDLTAPYNKGYKYQWYMDSTILPGDTGQTYTDSFPGAFQVLITNDSGCPKLTAPVNIYLNYPYAYVGATNKSNFCMGDTVTLTAYYYGNYPAFQWYKNATALAGDTAVTYKTTIADNYEVIVSYGTGCSGMSNPLNISFDKAPNSFIGINGDSLFCQGKSVNLIADSGTNYYYQWYNDTTIIYNSHNATYNASVTGTYKALITTLSGCRELSFPVDVFVYPLPTAMITKSGDTLISNAKTGNQWLRNDSVIKGATNQKYIALSYGSMYSVMVTDSNGCSSKSLPYALTGINEAYNNNNFDLKIYPNPFTNQTTIEATINENTPVSVAIYDMTGRQITDEVLRSATFLKSGTSNVLSQFTYTFDAAQYGCGSGMYVVKVVAGDAVVERKVVRIR